MNPVRNRDRFIQKIILNQMKSRNKKQICGYALIAICF